MQYSGHNKSRRNVIYAVIGLCVSIRLFILFFVPLNKNIPLKVFNKHFELKVLIIFNIVILFASRVQKHDLVFLYKGDTVFSMI